MSRKALPLLFINLSGEMMYILDQRLKAQNISKEKAQKVINDIVSTMFNEQFVEELFKHQEIYSTRALRTVFEKLVHSSIMRLNGASMDKLYDLMTMVLKYQICLCPRPEDLLFMTLNHLDGIRKYSQTLPEVLKLIDNVYMQFFKNYGNMKSGQLQLLRFTLLSFFQDLQIRVSVLLKEGTQRSSGKFVLPRGGPVPFGFNKPGAIRTYAPDGSVVNTASFFTEDEYEFAEPVGEMSKEGFRGTILGTNIYSAREESIKVRNSTTTLGNQGTAELIQQQETRAKEELSFLARLIGQEGAMQHSSSKFSLGFFDESGADVAANPEITESASEVVSIDGSQRMEQTTLHKIMGDLTIEANEAENNDILDLLDVASS